MVGSNTGANPSRDHGRLGTDSLRCNSKHLALLAGGGPRVLYQSDSSSRERCWNAKYSSMHENALVSSFIVFLLVSRRSSVLSGASRDGVRTDSGTVLVAHTVPWYSTGTILYCTTGTVPVLYCTTGTVPVLYFTTITVLVQYSTCTLLGKCY